MRTLFLVPLALLAGCAGGDKGGGDTGPAAGPADADGDGYTTVDDCDDTDPAVNPAAEETCNGVDDDCDDAVDEDLSEVFYVDADGDGHGNPAARVEDCAAPSGTVTNANDCDDTDADTHPGAPERCDEVDNDCDGTVDEDVATTWWPDVDGDGYGDPAAPLDACDPPEGYVADDQDCDDTEAANSPAGAEVCDEVDNDCDGVVDEEVTSTWYVDVDLDGYGLVTDTTEACAQPAGYAAEPGDCDDAEAAVNPGASEACNGVDDDCDGTVDESDAVDASRWYADTDADGYGDASVVTTACEAPSGTVADDTDCDDTTAAVNPGATEICNSVDDDCDGDVDDDDPSVSGAPTWYADTDVDGYGDAGDAVAACLQPSGTVSDDTDCDDTTADVSPAASEVCNGIDDDCDGSIDDDDSSLDTSTGSTWYADTDGDGLGDALVSVETCLQPSGYVSDDSDCDDTDATDTDGDGTQDCGDDDIDGDGLRNDWDADPYDDTVVRGPTGGSGADGDLVVSGTMTLSEWTLLDGAATAGDTTLAVDDGTVFSADDEVLVLSQQGSDAGAWQTVFVSAVSGNTLTIEPPLDASYAAASTVLVQRVPHYDDVDVPSGSTLRPEDWGGSGGGVVFLRAAGDVTIGGTVTAAERGFRGGNGVRGNSLSGQQGESVGGTGSRGAAAANGGGGGSYPKRGDNGDSGGGGGHGGAGSAGTNYSGSGVSSGGSVQGTADLDTLVFGSGGGAGSPDTEGDGTSTGNITGDGGDGGGILALFCSGSITVTGTVSANGETGGTATSAGGEVGAGGGGAGGAVWLAAPTITISGSVTATGAGGGTSAWHDGRPYGAAYGGAGGTGRVRLDVDTLTGSTSPTAGSTGSFVE